MVPGSGVGPPSSGFSDQRSDRLSYPGIHRFWWERQLSFPFVYTRLRRRYGVFFVCQRYFRQLLAYYIKCLLASTPVLLSRLLDSLARVFEFHIPFIARFGDEIFIPRLPTSRGLEQGAFLPTLTLTPWVGLKSHMCYHLVLWKQGKLKRTVAEIYWRFNLSALSASRCSRMRDPYYLYNSNLSELV